MRVTSRITAGYAILTGLMLGLLLFEIVSLHRIQAANKRNSGQNLQHVLAALQLMRDRDSVEDSARESFSNPSDASLAQLKVAREAFENDLAGVQSISGSAKGEEEVTRLTEFWKEFLAVLAKQQPQVLEAGPERRSVPLTPDLQEHLERLRAQTYSLYQAIAQIMTSEAEEARRAGDRAEIALWISAAIALAVAGCIFIWLVRTISLPLKHLTEGTRALAEGKVFYRLDTSRDDELSRIARDFNELTRRLTPDHQNRSEEHPSL